MFASSVMPVASTWRWAGSRRMLRDRQLYRLIDLDHVAPPLTADVERHRAYSFAESRAGA
jgi:hypothetical protein